MQNFSQDIEKAAAYCSPRGLSSSNTSLQASVSPKESNSMLERRASAAAMGKHAIERLQSSSSS